MVVLGSCCSVRPALATTIDFETLPDSSDVGNFYGASAGVDFQSAISLTAGISLNEIDYPPHSGSVVVSDNVANNGDPMVLTFHDPAGSLSAYFAYSSQLTFSAFDSSGTLLGSFTTATGSHLGSDEQITVPYSGISKLNIAGGVAGSFIMDDLNFAFDAASQSGKGVPETGSTLLLSLLSAACLILFGRNLRTHSCSPL